MTMEQQVKDAVQRALDEWNAELPAALVDEIVCEVVKSFTPVEHPHGDR